MCLWNLCTLIVDTLANPATLSWPFPTSTVTQNTRPILIFPSKLTSQVNCIFRYWLEFDGGATDSDMTLVSVDASGDYVDVTGNLDNP